MVRGSSPTPLAITLTLFFAFSFSDFALCFSSFDCFSVEVVPIRNFFYYYYDWEGKDLESAVWGEVPMISCGLGTPGS